VRVEAGEQSIAKTSIRTIHDRHVPKYTSEAYPSRHHLTVFVYRPYWLHTLSRRGEGSGETWSPSLVNIAPARGMDAPTPPSLLQPAIDANLPCVRTVMASSNTTSACAVPHARRSSPIELADSYHGGLEISAVVDLAGEHKSFIGGRPRYSTRSNQVYLRLILGQCGRLVCLFYLTSSNLQGDRWAS
jgi:hypothetical protein